MLEPGQRRLFMDTLRPPAGYVLDCAVGTTFTLDLMTLLSVPLAFTLRDAQDHDGQLVSDPLSLLEGARRYADRIVVFCHGGQTSVPRAGQPALAFIEDAVVTAFPPGPPRSGAVFHPKVWVLRFVSRDRTEPGTVLYRLICQSRNLTFDASWDASLVLDGVLEPDRDDEHPVNGPLADFIRTLPALASAPISTTQEALIAVMAEELPGVRFSSPEGLELRRFLPFGMTATNVRFPDLARRPLLVISPFLDGDLLRSLAQRRRRTVLISRRDELLTVSADAIQGFSEIYAFQSRLEPEPADQEELLPPLSGLHAKIYVIDDGWNARVAVGSANATRAALGNPPGNVEFMAELVGRKSRFGIDALLASAKEGKSGTFASLIEPFDPLEAGTVAKDEVDFDLDRILDATAEALARIEIRGRVEVSGIDRYSVRLDVGELPAWPAAISAVTCWPASIAATAQVPLGDSTTFTGLSLAELSAFLGLEVRARKEGKDKRKRFARRIQLSGLPEDRLPRLLAYMLRDRKRLMQLLWMLLSPDQEVSFTELADLLENQGVATDWGAALPGLLERMLETLGSDPSRLDAVASLLDDLRKSEDGKELIGTDFDAVWSALWTARGRIK